MVTTTPSSAPTVFVVDGDEVSRRSLALLIESAGLEVVPLCAAKEFLARYDRRMTGCLVTEALLPDMKGLELQARLRREYISIPVIFLTSHAGIAMAVQAMKAGAFDYLQKPCGNDELLPIIRRAIERDAMARRIRARRGASAARLALLSRREREVLDLVAAGHANKEIAHCLGIAPKTVEAHRASVMKKAGVQCLPDLIRLIHLLKAGVYTP